MQEIPAEEQMKFSGQLPYDYPPNDYPWYEPRYQPRYEPRYKPRHEGPLFIKPWYFNPICCTPPTKKPKKSKPKKDKIKKPKKEKRSTKKPSSQPPIEVNPTDAYPDYGESYPDYGESIVPSIIDLNGESRFRSTTPLPNEPVPHDCGRGDEDYVEFFEVRNQKILCIGDPKGGKSWTLIQRRMEGYSINYNRKWSEYENGFGEPRKEFWMGLKKIFKLTNLGHYELWVQLKNTEEERNARYEMFYVGSPLENYTLNVSKYSGDAGDSLQHHNGKQFSAYDSDNDLINDKCGKRYNRGWWMADCETR